MTILFLYTELADYTIACLKKLKEHHPEIQIVVVHYPVNPEAPFNFNFQEIGDFRCIADFKSFSELKLLVNSLSPQKIVVSGWANKWYLRLCLLMRTCSNNILAMDNHWKASVKQRIFALLASFVLPSIFKKIWIPGRPQLMYAQKLGFRQNDIIQGFYSCDTDFYMKLGVNAYVPKSEKFPRRLLCVARYIPVKNYSLLWNAFIEWKDQTNNDWELWCAGIGSDFDKRIKHPSIHHLGFVQKEGWEEIIQQTGVFILPSSSEPWGVVVHEFAASGYPMILSNKIGAATAFLNFQNGWKFEPDDKKGLMDIFNELEKLDDATLIKMGMESIKLAKKITPGLWSDSLLQS